jgi:homocysteine S-methyltransferase
VSIFDQAGPAVTGDGGLATGQAAQWVARGARVVGGCCRVSPADIADIARAVA